MFKRILSQKIENKIGKGKAIIVTGARQVGKTTLIQSILSDKRHLFLDCDDPAVKRSLTNPNTEELKWIIGTHTFVFVDEAQRIENIGITLKIIADQFREVQLFVSGSSSFELSDKTSEPLTGRKWEYELFPVNWEEFEEKQGYLVAGQQVENRVIYGMYPDVLNHPGEEYDVLKNLVNSYLYRDILAYSDIKKPAILDKLVLALALQVGNEVSYNELAQTVGIDKNTVSKYIDILEKGYVIFKLGSFSRNIRNEIKRNKKIYFYDNGIRNMIIGNFNPLENRVDKGALWENFLISERLKQNQYKNSMARMYFWRTTQQQEVDFVEQIADKIYGYEFKWITGKKKMRLPKTFVETYNAESGIIDRKNFREFVITE